MKSLARAGLVTSTRGKSGGYQLSRPAHDISAASVIDALEGPVSITECSASDSHCDIEEACSVGNAWQRINVAIRNALQAAEQVAVLDQLSQGRVVLGVGRGFAPAMLGAFTHTNDLAPTFHSSIS